jgi:hypothetical protein
VPAFDLCIFSNVNMIVNNMVKSRRIEFQGVHKNDSLLIGNHGDVEFIANGSFDLSGMIYSRKTVEFTVIGSGLIRFTGFCKRIIIHLVKGDSILDLSELSSKEVCCFSLRDRCRIMIGPTKVISRANVQDEAVFNYASNPLLQSYSVVGKARIEPVAAV